MLSDVQTQHKTNQNHQVLVKNQAIISVGLKRMPRNRPTQINRFLTEAVWQDGRYRQDSLSTNSVGTIEHPHVKATKQPRTTMNISYRQTQQQSQKMTELHGQQKIIKLKKYVRENLMPLSLVILFFAFQMQNERERYNLQKKGMSSQI